MELEVKWRRVWQVRPYETEEIELRLGGEFPIPPGTGSPPAAVGKAMAEIQRQLLAELATMGDQIMAQRLSLPDPRERIARDRAELDPREHPTLRGRR